MAVMLDAAKPSPSDGGAVGMKPVRGHRVTGWERYMALDRSESHSMTCFTRFWFRGTFDRDAFVRAVTRLVERHPLVSAHPNGSFWKPVPYDADALIDWLDTPHAIAWSHLPEDDFRTRWIVRRGPLRELGLDAEECGEDDGTLVVLQYAHAASDALGAVALMSELCGMLATTDAPIPSRADLDRRLHLGLTMLDRCRRLLWDAERIWRYFARRPLALATALPRPGDPGRILIRRRAMCPRETSRLRGACRERGITVNDVLLAAFMRALARKIDRPGWMRVAVPTSLRPKGNGSFCNLVSMVFLDRTASQARSLDVLADISAEMKLVKERSLGHAMVGFLKIGCLGRGALMKSFLRSGRTEATAVLSNLGCLFEDTASQLLEGFAPIATDTVSPLRPGTSVSLCGSHCAGRLSLTLRYDEAEFDADTADQMLSDVIEESFRLVAVAHPHAAGLGEPTLRTTVHGPA